MPEKVDLNFTVSKEVLASSGWNLESLTAAMARIGPHLKKAGMQQFTNVDSHGKIMRMMELDDAVCRWSSLEGFPDLMRQIASEPEGGAWTTLTFALYAANAGFPVTRFEPPTVGQRRADCEIAFGNGKATCECKRMSLVDDEQERRRQAILRVLAQDRNPAVQLTYSFREDMSDSEWANLRDIVKQRVASLTGPGTIVNNAKVSVEALPGPVVGNEPVDVLMTGLLEDNHTGEILPVTVVGGKGPSLAVAGPRLEAKRLVTQRLTVARAQASMDRPYLVVLDHSSVPISAGDLVDAAKKEFQPSQNTRIAGIVLLRSAMSDAHEVTTIFVQNPYAHYPVDVTLAGRLTGKGRITNRP